MESFTTEQKQIILTRLELMLTMATQNYQPRQYVGLCDLNSSANSNRASYLLGRDYIALNRPLLTYYRLWLNRPDSAFWWDQGNMKPRIKWLKKHINILTKHINDNRSY